MADRDADADSLTGQLRRAMPIRHERLVPELAWLEHDPHTALVRKDCINGFIGAIQPDGANRLVHWVNHNRLKTLLVVGICTDICVMDFVLTLLSARNHDMMPGLADILVYEPGCATYNLPRRRRRRSASARPPPIRARRRTIWASISWPRA